MAITLDLAIAAIRSGRKEEGRQLLNLLIQQNPNDELAWLWMSGVVDTEQQKARCLYHVLAIDPTSTVARRGLQQLGIQLTDSRPLKITKPPTKPQPVTQASSEVTQELPFTPRSDTPRNEESPQPPANGVEPPTQSGPSPRLLELSKALQEQEDDKEHDFGPTEAEQAPNSTPQQPQPQTEQQPGQNAAPFVPPLPDFNAAFLQVANMEQQIANGEQPLPQNQPPNPNESRPVPAPNPQTFGSQPTRPMSMAYQPYQPTGPNGAMVHPETRPTYAASIPHATTMGMPVPYPLPHPSEPVPVIHANTTMGMPYQPTGYSPQHHANTTMGMPIQPNAQFQYNPGVTPPYGTPNPQQTDQELIAAWQQQSDPRRHQLEADIYEENDEDEEVNVLAVVVFGSLSITALGGLGMLILLTFTVGNY